MAAVTVIDYNGISRSGDELKTYFPALKCLIFFIDIFYKFVLFFKNYFSREGDNFLSHSLFT